MARSIDFNLRSRLRQRQKEYTAQLLTQETSRAGYSKLYPLYQKAYQAAVNYKPIVQGAYDQTQKTYQAAVNYKKQYDTAVAAYKGANDSVFGYEPTYQSSSKNYQQANQAALAYQQTLEQASARMKDDYKSLTDYEPTLKGSAEKADTARLAYETKNQQLAPVLTAESEANRAFLDQRIRIATLVGADPVRSERDRFQTARNLTALKQKDLTAYNLESKKLSDFSNALDQARYPAFAARRELEPLSKAYNVALQGYQSAQRQYNNLAKQYTQSKSSYEESSKTYQSLASANTAAQKAFEESKATYDQLLAQNTSTQRTFQESKAVYDQLLAQNTAAQDVYQKEKANYEGLQTTYKGYEQQLGGLRSMLSNASSRAEEITAEVLGLNRSLAIDMEQRKRGVRERRGSSILTRGTRRAGSVR